MVCPAASALMLKMRTLVGARPTMPHPLAGAAAIIAMYVPCPSGCPPGSGGSKQRVRLRCSYSARARGCRPGSVSCPDWDQRPSPRGRSPRGSEARARTAKQRVRGRLLHGSRGHPDLGRRLPAQRNADEQRDHDYREAAHLRLSFQQPCHPRAYLLYRPFPLNGTVELLYGLLPSPAKTTDPLYGRPYGHCCLLARARGAPNERTVARRA